MKLLETAHDLSCKQNSATDGVIRRRPRKQNGSVPLFFAIFSNYHIRRSNRGLTQQVGLLANIAPQILPTINIASKN